MKTWIRSVALVALVASLTGCGTSGGLFVERADVREVVSEVPAATNLVQVPQSDGSVQVVQVVRPAAAVTNWTTNVVVTPNPRILSTIRTVGEINSAVNPLPFSGAITGALGLAAAVLGWVAKVKTDKARLLPAVIAGVEAAGRPEVKESIAQIARGLGVEKRLNQVVQEVTR